jgi:hypothetical protein
MPPPPSPKGTKGGRRGKRDTKAKPIPRTPLLNVAFAPELPPKRVLTVAEKRQTAWDLRIAGYAIADIATALELSEPRIYDLIKEYGADVAKYTEASRDEWRTMELARLDKLLLSHWRQRDVPKYAEIVLKVLERKHKLLGLESTHKHITGDVPAVGVSLTNLDLSKLSNQELEWLEIIITKATPVQIMQGPPVLDAPFTAIAAPAEST